jgi:hypothetical protein
LAYAQAAQAAHRWRVAVRYHTLHTLHVSVTAWQTAAQQLAAERMQQEQDALALVQQQQVVLCVAQE